MLEQNFLPTRMLIDRYKVCDRTIDRWLQNESMGFPKPIVINKRRYWRSADIVAWERERATRDVASN